MFRAFIVLALSATLCSADAASVATTRFGSLTRTNEVVTAVDLSGLARTDELPPAPDYSTNNTELVKTIEAAAPAPDFSTNNAELVQTVRDTSPAPDFSTGNTQLVATIEATAPAPDYSTNNAELVATIGATAPPPFDYAEVYSAAMSAVQPSALEPYCTIEAARQMTNGVMEEVRGGYLPISWEWGLWGVDRDLNMNGAVIFKNIVAFTSEVSLWGWEALMWGAQTLPEYLTQRETSLTNGLATAASVAAATNDLAQTIPSTASDVGAYPASDGNLLAAQVSAIGAHLNAEDAHFVSTNYDSVVHTPEAYVEIRMSNEWMTIWREMTRWNQFTGVDFDWTAWNGFHAFKTNVETELSFKADRAWGAYDSETGGYSPEGYTQISSSNILIAAGMAYQRTVTSGGSVWVLQCNQGTATLGGDTNGFFRVLDGEGATQFEIIKGDRREMGCDATGITVGSGSPPVVTIPYSVDAADHPTLRICDDLGAQNWKDETDADCLATVSWSGSRGAYVATVQRKAAGNALFVKATYMAGGETYVRNVAPVSVEGGILCTDGIHKVRPVYNNGNITWEVVP